MFLAIIPAYNEEKTIGSVVRGLFSVVDRVVVVDDGSIDQTARLAKEAGAVVLAHRINRGQGAALETGHAYAREVGADIVLHFDADDQFDPNDVIPAKQAMESSGADMLFGSRFLGKQSNMPFLKRMVLSRAGRLSDRFFAGIRLSDSHNGFRILSKRALDCIRITQDGMAHATEIPMLVKRHCLSYIEFPVTVTYHEYGQRAGGGIRIVRDLFLGKFV